MNSRSHSARFCLLSVFFGLMIVFAFVSAFSLLVFFIGMVLSSTISQILALSLILTLPLTAPPNPHPSPRRCPNHAGPWFDLQHYRQISLLYICLTFLTFPVDFKNRCQFTFLTSVLYVFKGFPALYAEALKNICYVKVNGQTPLQQLDKQRQNHETTTKQQQDKTSKDKKQRQCTRQDTTKPRGNHKTTARQAKTKTKARQRKDKTQPRDNHEIKETRQRVPCRVESCRVLSSCLVLWLSCLVLFCDGLVLSLVVVLSCGCLVLFLG